MCGAVAKWWSPLDYQIGLSSVLRLFPHFDVADAGVVDLPMTGSSSLTSVPPHPSQPVGSTVQKFASLKVWGCISPSGMGSLHV